MHRTWENLTTKEKIIKATMEIIAKEGFYNITIRKIASRADVNIAAVNYHFGSKDGVIDAALATVTDEMKTTFTLLKESGSETEARLLEFIDHYTEVIHKYPDLIKNLIDMAIHNKPLNKQAEYMTFLKNEGIALIKAAIAEVRPEAAEEVLNICTLQLLSALSFPVLMGDHILDMTDVDLKDEQVRQHYILILLEFALGRGLLLRTVPGGNALITNST